MTSYSRFLTDEQVKSLVDAIEGSEFLSKRDGCRVVLVRCTKCGASFEEEFLAAKERTAARLDFLCLGCDPDASVQAFSRLTIKIGWVLE